MAGVVIEVLRALQAIELDAALHQVFMDVEQPAPGEDLVELVLLQLIEAGAAGDDDGADVEVVERVGDAMEQHAVLHRDRLTDVLVTA